MLGRILLFAQLRLLVLVLSGWLLMLLSSLPVFAGHCRARRVCVGEQTGLPGSLRRDRSVRELIDAQKFPSRSQHQRRELSLTIPGLRKISDGRISLLPVQSRLRTHHSCLLFTSLRHPFEVPTLVRHARSCRDFSWILSVQGHGQRKTG